ncbi:RNA polymerase sigma factor SigF [Streptomyces sp. NBC_01537]|uniref:RNA polymerase sigma factor SigF n=1 Tax=Streptomyces sp. NBC_01537 TaxID=2903896 RepID=UPI00386B7458
MTDQLTAPVVADATSQGAAASQSRTADGTMNTAQVRDVSRTMFARLAVLEEGTEEYQYVRNTLIELNMTLVRFAARRFGTRAEQMEDILQVGTIGLIKAINRFDPDFGVEFVTYAMPTIVGEIKRFFRDTNWSVRVPRRLQELRIHIAKATDTLAAELGRAPTVPELAERLEVSEADVSEAMVAANAYTATSLDIPATDGEDGGASWASRLGYEDPALEGVENVSALKPLIAALPDRDREILSLRFGAEMTQAQIGAELGYSQMHVSRLLSRTLRTLRRQLLADF